MCVHTCTYVCVFVLSIHSILVNNLYHANGMPTYETSHELPVQFYFLEILCKYFNNLSHSCTPYVHLCVRVSVMNSGKCLMDYSEGKRLPATP